MQYSTLWLVVGGWYSVECAIQYIVVDGQWLVFSRVCSTVHCAVHRVCGIVQCAVQQDKQTKQNKNSGKKDGQNIHPGLNKPCTAAG